MSHKSHKTRMSDSSLYDEVCTLCGATDYNGMGTLNRPCPNRMRRYAALQDERAKKVKAWEQLELEIAVIDLELKELER